MLCGPSPDVLPLQVDHRAEKCNLPVGGTRGNRLDSLQPGTTGAADQPHEKGLHVVVEVVRQNHVATILSSCGFSEKGMAEVSGDGFNRF